MLTLMPRLLSRRPRDDAAIPLPSDETTPPVKKMYLVIGPPVPQRRTADRTGRPSGSSCPLATPPRSLPLRAPNGHNSCTLRFRSRRSRSFTRPAPRMSGRAARSLQRSDDPKQQRAADERDQNAPEIDPRRAGLAERTEQPPSEDRAQDADREVAEYASGRLAWHYELRQKTGDDPDDDPRQQSHGEFPPPLVTSCALEPSRPTGALPRARSRPLASDP